MPGAGRPLIVQDVPSALPIIEAPAVSDLTYERMRKHKFHASLGSSNEIPQYHAKMMLLLLLLHLHLLLLFRRPLLMLLKLMCQLLWLVLLWHHRPPLLHLC